MYTFARVLVIVGIILYVISPIDLLPGPIDDIIVMVLGYIWQKKLAESNQPV